MEREEIDISPSPNDSIPPGIKSDDFDSEDDDNSTSLPEFESFHVDYPDSGDSTIDVVEDIPVDVPNILPTHPTLHMDFDFIPSHNDLGYDLDVSSLFGDRNKIYDPGICIEVESTRFLATLSPMIDTLLPFLSENEDKTYQSGKVIQNGNGPLSITHIAQGQVKVLPPRTAEEILARERERKARTTLLMALPEDHLAKFHKITNAKEMWDAIKSRLGENDNHRRFQKSNLKQHIGGFLLYQTQKDYIKANDEVFKSFMIVFENDVKGSTESSSSTKNVAFVSENTISTNDVSTAYGVSNPSSHNSQYEQTSSYSLLANQSVVLSRIMRIWNSLMNLT
ncbi:hypothetical protein Tco_0979960 [Tanacetum coccineum]